MSTPSQTSSLDNTIGDLADLLGNDLLDFSQIDDQLWVDLNQENILLSPPDSVHLNDLNCEPLSLTFSDNYSTNFNYETGSNSSNDIHLTPPDTPPDCESIEHAPNKRSHSTAFISNVDGKQEQCLNNQNAAVNQTKQTKYAKILPQPTVLTQQTSSILLYPALGQTTAKLLMPTVIPITSPTAMSTSTLPSQVQTTQPKQNQVRLPSELELKKQKSQQIREARMQRNREAALLSRKKKKDRLEQLERDLQLANQLNNELKQENANLKQKLQQFAHENDFLRKKFGLPSVSNLQNQAFAKKTISLLAICFLVALNIGPLTDQIIRSDSNSIVNSKSVNSVHSGGRTLLWAKEDDLKLFPSLYNMSEIYLTNNSSFSSTRFNSSQQINCQTTKGLNQTDSLRFDFELRNLAKWQQRRQNETLNKQTAQRQLRNWLLNSLDAQMFASSSKSLFDANSIDLRKSIRLQADTYYLLYLQHPSQVLLPPKLPSSKQFRSGAKFSILFPAYHSNVQAPNRSSSRNQTFSFSDRSEFGQSHTLMQIDCQISNLRFVRISNSFSSDSFVHLTPKSEIKLDKPKTTYPLSNLTRTNTNSTLKKFRR